MDQQSCRDGQDQVLNRFGSLRKGTTAMRTNHPLRNLAFAAGLFAAVTGLLLAGSRPAWTDDGDLLRFDTGNPYLFIVLDTSGSMNLPLDKNVTSLPGDG